MITHQKYNWDNTPYGDEKESLPTDAPTPLGKRVVLTHYFDANLMHDVLSGKAVTGCFHLVNKTPIMWYSKKQATSETTTYGSEFIACRPCCPVNKLSIYATHFVTSVYRSITKVILLVTT